MGGEIGSTGRGSAGIPGGMERFADICGDRSRGRARNRGPRARDTDRCRTDLSRVTERDHHRSPILLVARIIIVVGSAGLGRMLVMMVVLVMADVEVVVEEVKAVVDVEVEVVEPGERHIAHDEGDDGGEHHRPRNPGRLATTHHRLDLPRILPDRGRPERLCGARPSRLHSSSEL